jgi:transposase
MHNRIIVRLLPGNKEVNPVRVVDIFVDGLKLDSLGFRRVDAKRTGRPGYHPATLLKLYIYGYLNRLQSSRRLEKEAHRNVELMWLLERLWGTTGLIFQLQEQYG